MSYRLRSRTSSRPTSPESSSSSEDSSSDDELTEIPVYTPTWDEFKDFNAFVESIEKQASKIGLAKVIPPPEFFAHHPRFGLDDGSFMDTVLKEPNTQELTESKAQRGVYEVSNWETPAMTVREFREDALDLQARFPPRVQQFFKDRDYTALEDVFWKSATTHKAKYGADTPGTLFREDNKYWNMQCLGSMLDAVEEEMKGINSPFLYVGQWKASFPFHVEDMNLHSINYIHTGSSKQWYVIPPDEHEAFERFAKARFPEEYEECPEFLRHKTTLVSPRVLAKAGITVHSIVQNHGEFMLTFPHGYHQGFNYGFNIAESVNFATPRWVPSGREARTCECQPDVVRFSVDRLLSKWRSNQRRRTWERRKAQAKEMRAAFGAYFLPSFMRPISVEEFREADVDVNKLLNLFPQPPSPPPSPVRVAKAPMPLTKRKRHTNMKRKAKSSPDIDEDGFAVPPAPEKKVKRTRSSSGGGGDDDDGDDGEKAKGKDDDRDDDEDEKEETGSKKTRRRTRSAPKKSRSPPKRRTRSQSSSPPPQRRLSGAARVLNKLTSHLQDAPKQSLRQRRTARNRSGKVSRRSKGDLFRLPDPPRVSLQRRAPRGRSAEDRKSRKSNGVSSSSSSSSPKKKMKVTTRRRTRSGGDEGEGEDDEDDEEGDDSSADLEEMVDGQSTGERAKEKFREWMQSKKAMLPEILEEASKRFRQKLMENLTHELIDDDEGEDEEDEEEKKDGSGKKSKRRLGKTRPPNNSRKRLEWRRRKRR